MRIEYSQRTTHSVIDSSPGTEFRWADLWRSEFGKNSGNYYGSVRVDVESFPAGAFVRTIYATLS